MSWLTEAFGSHSEERAAAMTQAQEQINYYNYAKNKLKEERKTANAAKMMERDKINETQLRSRQRLFKRYGFLNEPTAQPSETVG